MRHILAPCLLFALSIACIPASAADIGPADGPGVGAPADGAGDEEKPPAKEEKKEAPKPDVKKEEKKAAGKTMAEFQLTKRMFKSKKGYYRGALGDRLETFYKSCEKSGRRKERPSTDPVDLLDYKAEDQSAVVFIPSEFDGSAGWGVYVHIGGDAKASLPPDWDKVLVERKLLFASPHKAADVMPDMYRVALALDTLASLQAEYKLDKNRVFVGGAGSGGACAIVAALAYPDIIKGVICQKYGFILQRTPYSTSAETRIHTDKKADGGAAKAAGAADGPKAVSKDGSSADTSTDYIWTARRRTCRRRI